MGYNDYIETDPRTCVGCEKVTDDGLGCGRCGFNFCEDCRASRWLDVFGDPMCFCIGCEDWMAHQ